MNEKQAFFFRIILAVVFMIGGCVYFVGGEQIYAGAFLLAGLVFGYKAIKGKNKEE